MGGAITGLLMIAQKLGLYAPIGVVAGDCDEKLDPVDYTLINLEEAALQAPIDAGMSARDYPDDCHSCWTVPICFGNWTGG